MIVLPHQLLGCHLSGATNISRSRGHHCNLCLFRNRRRSLELHLRLHSIQASRLLELFNQQGPRSQHATRPPSCHDQRGNHKRQCDLTGPNSLKRIGSRLFKVPLKLRKISKRLPRKAYLHAPGSSLWLATPTGIASLAHRISSSVRIVLTTWSGLSSVSHFGEVHQYL